MLYETIWGPHEVIRRFRGFMSGAELVQSAVGIASDRRFDDLRVIFNDWLEVEGHSITPDTMEELVVIRIGSRTTNPNLRVVLLTTDPRLAAFAETTRAGFFQGTFETKAFPSLESARAWLALQPPLTHVPTRGA